MATTDQIVDTAVELAEQKSWEAVRLHDVAASLGITLDDVRAHFREKEDIVDAWFERADSAMLKAARTRLAGMDNVQLRSGALESLPIADAELDLAAFVLVLHHLAEPEAALREASRALREGGRLLIVDMMPHEHADYRQQMGHVWQGFPETQLQGWLAAAGLGSPRYQALPPDATSKGPTLFVATAVKPETATR